MLFPFIANFAKKTSNDKIGNNKNVAEPVVYVISMKQPLEILKIKEFSVFSFIYFFFSTNQRRFVNKEIVAFPSQEITYKKIHRLCRFVKKIFIYFIEDFFKYFLYIPSDDACLYTKSKALIAPL